MQKYHGPIFGAKTIPTTYYISYIAVGKKDIKEKRWYTMWNKYDLKIKKKKTL